MRRVGNLIDAFLRVFNYQFYTSTRNGYQICRFFMSKNSTQTQTEENIQEERELENLAGFFELLLKVDRRVNPQNYERPKL